jgi:hypothetical protein
MAIVEDNERALRRFALPAVAGVVGTAAALFLTLKQKTRSSTNDNSRGIGDLTDDLRRKLDSVLNKGEQSSHDGLSDARPPADFIPEEFGERRREREERRRSRRGKR